MIAQLWVADDFAALILVASISATLVMLAGVVVYRGVTRDDFDTKRLGQLMAGILAVMSALIGFLFGQSLG